MHSADSVFLFGTGRSLCFITGSKKLIDLIPTQWKDFQKDLQQRRHPVQNRTMIRLEEAAIGHDGGAVNGWRVQDPAERRQAVYIRNGKPVFALQYESDQEITVRIERALDSYVRIGIHYAVLLALHQYYVGLHGVTLLCGDEIVILSAPSGTGKTTLARLLEQYCDAIVINGDFALLSPTEEGVFFEPTPFCGTSGRCLNHRVMVNRLVFLEQSPDNRWEIMSGREALARLMSNAFVPFWDREMKMAAQENIMKCISGMRVNLFSFAPVREAAEMFSVQLETAQ